MTEEIRLQAPPAPAKAVTTAREESVNAKERGAREKEGEESSEESYQPFDFGKLDRQRCDANHHADNVENRNDGFIFVA